MITWLPAAGTTITRGQRAYAVNDQSVPLFYGEIPLFRYLDTKSTVGRAVRMVFDNLRALGSEAGRQPSPGTVVTQPVPSSADTTGTSPPSAAVLPAAVRVSALSAQIGAPATGELRSTTSTSKVVTVLADQSEAATVDNGDHATVVLSDDTTTPATVTSVGAALQTQDGGDPSSPKLTITLVLDQPSKLKRVDSADLRVSFAAQTHKQVLTVAISALLALQEGGYALQTPAGALIALTTGIFADGRVEVSGTGIDEGMTVVTTS